jgi:hypothetical protein
MGTVIHFGIYLFLTVCFILLCIVLGDYGPWYLVWLLGTVMMVLIAAASGALLDTQEEVGRGGR